jgi:tartrate dehydratase alpha subunit/fumarate hydratase class I-like protein
LTLEPLSKYVLEQIGCNYEAAVEDKRPMCGDTGLPRYFVKMGNDCRLEGGFAALERALRMVVDTHIEIAYAHTGGMPVAIHTFCFASRRATARLTPDGQVRFRSDPQWFTPYYRREGIE